MLTLLTYDGVEVVVSADLGKSSQFIRNLIEEEGSASPIILTHESCTKDLVSRIFEIANTAINHQTDDASKQQGMSAALKSVKDDDLETVKKMFFTAMYLDFDVVLCTLSKVRGLLHALAHSECEDGVRAMIEQKADVDARNADGKTAAEVATHPGILEELERARLMASGYTPFMIEASMDRTARMLEILDASADRAACLRAKCGWGHTALHIACKKGHIQTARALLDANALLEACDVEQYTPLHLAAEWGHLEITAALLAAGAAHGARIVPGRGQTPLHLAAARGHADVVRLLLAAHADVDDLAETQSCWWWERDVTPLHAAVGAGQAGTAALLIAARCNVNTA